VAKEKSKRQFKSRNVDEQEKSLPKRRHEKKNLKQGRLKARTEGADTGAKNKRTSSAPVSQGGKNQPKPKMNPGSVMLKTVLQNLIEERVWKGLGQAKREGGGLTKEPVKEENNQQKGLPLKVNPKVTGGSSQDSKGLSPNARERTVEKYQGS